MTLPNYKIHMCLSLLITIMALIFPAVVLADSAAAWKTYQEGKNPLLEVALLVVGIVFFFSFLVWLNNMTERRKKERKTNNTKNKSK